MRVGVIRNDLAAPILLADLEQVSRRNDPVDAPGQVRYISFATNTVLEAALADPITGAGATITGSDISGSLPLTLVASTSDDLKLKTASGDAFITYKVAAGAYTTIGDLVAAINVALGSAPIQAFDGGNDNIVLESTSFGVGSYLENDNEAGGSNANVELGFADGAVRTMPAAATYATAIGIPGAIDVSQATIEAVGATTNSRALEPHYDAGLARGGVGLANAVAPELAETDTVLDSYLVGMVGELASANFNPDSRNSASVVGAAVVVLENDGSTAFATANTLPTITSATLDSPAAGDVTIAGTSLGNENGSGTGSNGVVVKFTGVGAVRLEQREIIEAGGSVLPTAIIIPASMVPGVATTTTSVQVQVRQLPLTGVEVLV